MILLHKNWKVEKGAVYKFMSDGGNWLYMGPYDMQSCPIHPKNIWFVDHKPELEMDPAIAPSTVSWWGRTWARVKKKVKRKYGFSWPRFFLSGLISIASLAVMVALGLIGWKIVLGLMEYPQAIAPIALGVFSIAVGMFVFWDRVEP